MIKYNLAVNVLPAHQLVGDAFSSMHEGEAQIVSGEQSALGMGTFNPMQCNTMKERLGF